MELYDKYVGAVLSGRYRIERIIGVGGMAVVFKAFDLLMNKHVAIKLLKEEIAGEEDSVKRFVNESKAVAMMSHRNVVSIYDVNVSDDIKYIVMEYIEGITLRNYMTKRGRLTLREIISYTEQILLALSHTHSKGLVHRDIKPQNIMLLKSGIIKVTDFGIAKLPNAETVTMTDKAIGTVYYISPEQASGHPIDRRSDLYSLGVMMYEMATGELPFTADTPVSVAMMQINDQAKAPSELNPDIPKGLEQIIGIAMEKDPQYRYQSAEDMLRHIRRLKENPGVIFKIPKKHEEGEPKSVLSLLTGGGPAFPMIAGVALAFFIVFAIGAAFVLGKASDAMSQTVETIEVDDFEGRNYDATLAEALENSDKYTVKIEYEYSDAYEAGVIMEQSPAAGSSKKVKVELTLTVCSGNREIDMPSLSDYNYKAAIKELRNRGLDYAIEYKKDNIRSSGQVISTSPAAGEKVKVGSTVTVYVCDGFEDGDIKVPDFVGMTEKKAFKKLVELDLLPGAVSYVKDKADRGTVIKQSVEKDKEVLPNTRIGLTISGGPDYDPANPDGTTAPEETTEPPETTAPDTTTVDTTDAETTEAETTDPVTEDTTDSETTGDGAAEETTGPADNESADNSQSN
ncbi:MAG: PASTA domain-containing protein [Ruminococcaceae bacterium]|nr:PASTA domain-containing protein [Oscillospiraceae bacterium]